MAVDVAPVAPPDAGPLHRLIRRTRFLLRTTRVAAGLALTAGLLLGALALVVAADLLLPLLRLPYWLAHGCDAWLRLASLVLVVAPPAVVFLAGVLFPLVRRLSAGHVARRIEAHLPGIHNRLVSCIDLEARGRAAASPVFYRRLVAESLERIRGFRPGRVLDFRGLRRAGLAALVGAAAFALVVCLFSAQMPRAFARIFHPFDDLPPVGAADFTVAPQGGDFLREEKIDFATDVTRGQAGALTLELAAADGTKQDFALQPAPDAPSSFRLQLDTVSLAKAFQDGFDYRVHGAGTWSPLLHIRLVERPLITAIDTAVYYPAYMGIPEAHPTPREASEITGPEGGEIELAIQAEGQVTEGEIQLLKLGVQPVAPEKQAARVWFEDAPPVGVPDASVGGAWNRETKGKKPVHTEPTVAGSHGHWFQGDPKGFDVQKGDELFADVFIDPEARPDEILLEWNDGKGWEHRAYWGVDLMAEGKTGTESRLPMDKVPEAGGWLRLWTGGWVRLFVPAKAVGLEGKTVSGMAFKLNGGRCWWGKSGAVRMEEAAYLVDRALPMQADGAGRWVGRLPLEGRGAFRAELRNAQKAANKPMTELHYAAAPDKPPVVLLQQPGAELTLPQPKAPLTVASSFAGVAGWPLALDQPQAPSLTVAAYDDYGLAEVRLCFRTDESQPYQSRTLVDFGSRPERNRTVVAAFREVKDLKPGGAIHYHVVAYDRRPQWDGRGQRARAPEKEDAVIRIAADPNAPDPEGAFDNRADAFHDRLVQLIAEQKKVQTAVDKTTTQFAQITEKLRHDQEAAPPTPPADPTKPPPPPPKDGPKMDPETAKQLAELQKQLAELAKQQDKNAQNASQLNNDLAAAAAQADALQSLPQPLVQEMQSLQQAFEQTAVHGMQNLTQQLNQGANPQSGAPNLPDIGRKTDRLTQDLEGLKDRLEAIDRARKGLHGDLDKVMEELREKMLAESGQMTERDLQELRDFLARMREEMKDLQNQQQQLFDATQQGGDPKDIEQKQEDLDRKMKNLLDAARKLLDSKRITRRRPHFPDEPYDPDGDEEKAPPKDEDSNTPLPNAKKPDGKDDHPGDKKPDDAKDDDKEPLDMPALGGPKQVPDPRYDKKRRPVEKKPGDKDDPESQRDELESHHNDRMRDLDTAEKSLAADQQTLEQMMHSLEQAMQNNGRPNQGKPHAGQPDEADEAMRQLEDTLQSPAMRAARDMLGRMRRGQASQARQPGQPQNQPPPPSQTPVSQNGNNPMAPSAELAALPPDARQAILKLPPRVREELLQGLREQGPDGYGPFIEDYFKRLTESKNP